MGARQDRQRPRASSQPTTGTLSCQATGAPQEGQRDLGRATDSRCGTRSMATLANDPAARPSSPESEAAASGVMGGKPTCPPATGERVVNIRTLSRNPASPDRAWAQPRSCSLSCSLSSRISGAGREVDPAPALGSQTGVLEQ